MKIVLTRSMRSSLSLLLIIPMLAAGCASTPSSPPANQGTSPASSSSSPATSYTAADVAKHAAPDDCWLIVDGGVYNVTSFVSQHPGGPDRITAFCGKDASAPFHQKPSGQPHSQRASDILKSLQIGTLAQ